MFKICDIATRNELADFLKIPPPKLTYILYVKKVDKYYTSFTIPKKNGGVRYINAPTGDLKDIQGKLADALWAYQKSIWLEKGISPNISHAFEKNKGIITNASVHRNKKIIINIDLEDFFGCFHFGRVRGYFEKNREFQLPREVATVIAQLVCYDGCLPQGAPSSPIITNMICQILDTRLLKTAKKYKMDYTRYADDLTFSTNNGAFLKVQSEFYDDISKELQKAGFKINNKKTRLQLKDSKQKVTGLIVNQKLNVDRIYCKKTRAMAHCLYTQKQFTIDGSEGTIQRLEGRFSFINQLDYYNNNLGGTHNFRDLNSREKQYQRFLFYKYFFFNDKPLIVTEGKTDIVYLKSALKNLSEMYPKLVKKNSDGRFEFKVAFLKRSKRLEYFFGISLDGADSMKNLYNYFNPKTGCKKHYPDHLSYFIKICDCKPRNPIFMVFDNELSNKSKPLNNFANHVNLTPEKRATLIRELSVQLIDGGNLFLLTNPLVDGKSECEIEDLFDTKTLNQIIGGKTFSRAGNFDLSKHYGKEIFSQYVSANYEKINFSGFKGILDNLNWVIEQSNNLIQ